MTADQTPPALVTVTSIAAPSHPETTGGYLLCIEEGASWMVPLPVSGELVIGREPECGLVLAHALVSRRHAKLTVLPDGLRLADLDSRHGTLLNGERVTRPRALLSGDVVSLGNAILVVHRSARAALSRALLEGAELTQRLEVELERCLRYERALTLAVLRTEEHLDRGRVVAALGGRLRLIDAAALVSDQELCVLLPELGDDEADEAVLAIARVLGPRTRVGLAISPQDGCDADTLRVAARAAAERAAPGTLETARRDFVEMPLGGRLVTLADPAMRRLYELIRRLARSDLPILIHGETGAGKEIAATAIHEWSPRAARPLVSINCAALPEQLAESELFGHERGAFSGAVSHKLGLLEAASGGTVFFDEIAELPLVVQAKLLRALEAQRITRVGDVREREIDVRIVAATHRDLAREVAEGRFRQDLLFRLNAARVAVPPLRDRRRELSLLAEHLLAAACTRARRAPLELSTATLQALALHDWPGNVRELKNAMDFAAAAAREDASMVEPWHLPEDVGRRAREGSSDLVEAQPPGLLAASKPESAARRDAAEAAFRPIGDEVRELERRRMSEALAACDGQQNRAADLIEMPLRTFVTKLKRYRITPADWRRVEGP